jgi:hypothetical protein
MTEKLKEHLQFMDKMEKIIPGFKKLFHRAIKREAKITQGMSMLEFLKHCSL